MYYRNLFAILLLICTTNWCLAQDNDRAAEWEHYQKSKKAIEMAEQGGENAKQAVSLIIELIPESTEPQILGLVHALAETGEYAKPAIPSLQRLLRTARNWELRGTSAATLGKIGQQAAVAHYDLVHALKYDRHPVVREQAAEALGGIGISTAEVKVGLQEALNDESQYVVEEAQAALAKIKPNQEFMASIESPVEKLESPVEKLESPVEKAKDAETKVEDQKKHVGLYLVLLIMFVILLLLIIFNVNGIRQGFTGKYSDKVPGFMRLIPLPLFISSALAAGYVVFSLFITGFIYILWWIIQAILPRLASIVSDSGNIYKSGDSLPPFWPDPFFATLEPYFLLGLIIPLFFVNISVIMNAITKDRENK